MRPTVATVEVQPGTVLSVIQAPMEITIATRHTPTPKTPAAVATLSGAAEKVVTESTARATILVTGYFVFPAARAARVYRTSADGKPYQGIINR
jgi:hypothetical protein